MQAILAQQSLRWAEIITIATGKAREYTEDRKGNRKLKKDHGKPVLQRWERLARGGQPQSGSDQGPPPTLEEFAIEQGRIDPLPTPEEEERMVEEIAAKILAEGGYVEVDEDGDAPGSEEVDA